MEFDLVEAMDCSCKMNLIGNFQENSVNSVQSPSENCSRNIIETFGQFVHKFSGPSSKIISVSPEMITKSLKEAFPRKTAKLFQKHAMDHCSFSVSKKISPKVKTIQKSLQRVSFAKFHRQTRESFTRTPGKGSLKIGCTGVDSKISKSDKFQQSSSTFTPTINLGKINKNRNESFAIRSNESCYISNTVNAISAEAFGSSNIESLQNKQSASLQRKFRDSSMIRSSEHFSSNSNLFSKNSSGTLPIVINDSFPNLNEPLSRNYSQHFKSNNHFALNSNDHFITNLTDSFPRTNDAPQETSDNLLLSKSEDSFQMSSVESFSSQLSDSFQRNYNNSFSKTDRKEFSGIYFNSNSVSSGALNRIGDQPFPRFGDEPYLIVNEYFPSTSHEYFHSIGHALFLENGEESFARKSFENFQSNSSEIYSRGSGSSSQRGMFSKSDIFKEVPLSDNTFPSGETLNTHRPEILKRSMHSNGSTDIFHRNNSKMFSETPLSDTVFEDYQVGIFGRNRCNSNAEFCRDKTADNFITNEPGKIFDSLMANFSEKLTDVAPDPQRIVSLKKNKTTEKTKKSHEKALMPMISSNSLYVDNSALMDNLDPGLPYDPNRRSSLGAESLLEHDISEEGNMFDNEGIENLLYAEAQLGLEYADDIFNLYRSREKIFHPYNCMDDQPQVTEYMRCTLVHWLTKVNHQLKFQPETIFIAVSLTDRFLASTPIAQDCLQLLAVCALFVAAKLEELSVPGISALVSLCGKTYKHHHFRRMEKLLLSTLSFELHAPTSWFFVTHLMLKTCQLTLLDRRMLSLARDAVETCLGSYSISQFLPSEQAAAAICYSFLVLYAPTSIREISLLTSSCKESSSAGLHSDDADERWKLHKILSLNSAGSSLMWVFFNVFTNEEIGNINKCLEILTPYMEPFLQSLTLETESAAVSDAFKSTKTLTATFMDGSSQQQRQGNTNTVKFDDNLKELWKEKCHESVAAACLMEGSREQTGSTFCFGQSDFSNASVSRYSQSCELCRDGQHVSQMNVCNTNYKCWNSGITCCRDISRPVVLSTPANGHGGNDGTLYKEGDIYTSDFIEVNNEQDYVKQREDDHHLINTKSRDVEARQSKFKSFFNH